MGLFSGKRPDILGVKDGRLAPCPTSPNCVSSQAEPQDTEHHVAPIAFSGDPQAAWAKFEAAVRGMAGTTIVTARPGYLHAEFASSLLGFVDDFEGLLDSGIHVIHVRSASRLGYSDLGVNRKRVDSLKAVLAA